MEIFEEFAARNAAWNSQWGWNSEKDMRENYEIALAVNKKYQESVSNAVEPKKGDVVEFSDGFRVYRHAHIVENLYGNSKYGMVCVCENGSSWTDGMHFSTSGGAFRSFHKSLFRLVGTDEIIVWTWGCHGVGANQGIYFPLKVRKWIIPYEPVRIASQVTINKNGKDYKVGIKNIGDWYNEESFRTLGAFLAWAEYVGYKHENYEHGSFLRTSPQRLQRMCVCKESEIPTNGKPIKTISNGRARDAWVVNNGDGIITTYVENYKPFQITKYGTPEYEEEIRMFHKYSGNPMGIELLNY